MFRDVLTQVMSEACLFFSAEFFTRKQYLSRNSALLAIALDEIAHFGNLRRG